MQALTQTCLPAHASLIIKVAGKSYLLYIHTHTYKIHTFIHTYTFMCIHTLIHTYIYTHTH